MSEQNKTVRSDFVEEEHLIYLDKILGEGETNMWTSGGAYIEYAFSMDREKASEVVGYWMRTYSTRHPEVKS